MLHSDSWKQFKIKDIASIGRGRVISSVEISQQDNPLYPVYSSQTSNEGIMGYLDNFMFEGEYINWTTDGANAGTVFYRDGKFNCTNVCGLLKLGDEFDTYFVSLVLAEATKKYVSTNLANPKLMNNTMGSIQIRLPKLKEQKRISIAFRKLRELLEVHNSLLTEYSKFEAVFTLADVHINICESKYPFCTSYLIFAFSSIVNLLFNEVISNAIIFCFSFEGSSITSGDISEI